jgi:hypothetical protein
MIEREEQTEIVKQGIWLYDDQLPWEVWIVKQNFEFHYEKGYEDGPEELNSDGEAFQVVYARDGQSNGTGPTRLSLQEAISAAEEAISPGIVWTNDVSRKLYGGRRYSTYPIFEDEQ